MSPFQSQTIELPLDARVEALLFFKGEPVKTKELSKYLGVSESDVSNALDELEKSLSGRGLKLMRKDDFVTLASAPEMSGLIEELIKSDLNKDLGKAGLETLTVILYRGPVKRADVDYIRGVNSQYILRHLMVRGLIDRKVNPLDQRSYIYQPTFELLGHLGIARVEDLPEYSTVRQEIDSLKTAQGENDD